MTPAETLTSRWLERAATLQRYAADERSAAIWRLAAAELKEVTYSWEDELLSLHEAASESGYSVEHLGRLLRDGEVPNAGRKHAPRIRRGNLPRKPKRPDGHVAPNNRRIDISDRLFRDITTSKYGD